MEVGLAIDIQLRFQIFHSVEEAQAYIFEQVFSKKNSMPERHDLLPSFFLGENPVGH